MGDHFVLLVDRLLTESTLEAAIESRNRLKQSMTSTIDDTITDCSLKDSGADLTPRKMVECRICQDEDWDSNMETPCSCCGSLKVSFLPSYTSFPRNKWKLDSVIPNPSVTHFAIIYRNSTKYYKLFLLSN